MDVTELGNYSFPTVGIGERHLHIDTGAMKESVGRDVALAGAKALLAAYEGLAERHEKIVKVLERFDEVDITEMIDVVNLSVVAHVELTNLYRRHANREWIADAKTLKAAYEKWKDADSRVTENSRVAFRTFVGEIPKVPFPDIPLELMTRAVRASGYFFYMADWLAERHGLTRVLKLTQKVFRSHSDLQRFVDLNNYTLTKKSDDALMVYNSEYELVGRVERSNNPHGQDTWNYKFVNLYEGG